MPDNSVAQIAGLPELEATSESEEMYLITAARAVEDGTPEPIPVGVIAESLAVSVASVNEMVRKLADRGLLDYEPYRGVRLSERGHAVADRVLRTRRLWATFLADHLGFSPIEADDQACHLEHVTDTVAVERLAAFLHEPEADPLGRRIPGPAGVPDPGPVTATLSEVAVGDVAEVVSIEGPSRASSFLAAEGIAPGGRLTVLGAGATGVLVEGKGPVHVSRDLAAQIHVRAGVKPHADD